jgi:hypothetical protein
MNTVYKKRISIILVILLVLGGWNGLGGSKAYAAVDFAGGTGIESDPYQIATAAQLDEVRNHLGAGLYFELTADIDLGSFANWVQIGTDSSPFSGNIDGNSHIITGLKINNSTAFFNGLFGQTAAGSSISNLNLKDVNITGTFLVGGLVGNNLGTISNSSVTGSVYGNDTVGGLVGENDGTISNSYSEANVNAPNWVGGLVGRSWYAATISNSYATGSVTGTSYVGGLVGSNRATITNSYAAGLVSGTNYVGGLAGESWTTINNSFYSETTGQSDTGKGIGKSTTEMQLENTYTGWNFDSDWFMLSGQYPQLWAFTALTRGTAPTSAVLTAGTDDVGSTKLTGVTSEMEYKVNTGPYMTISDTTVDNIDITVGDLIYVRVKATAAQPASMAQVLNVGFANIKSAGSITSQAITGVTAPVTRGTPISSIPSTAEYRASIVWSPAEATFAAGVTYTAIITITPIHGYTFTDVTPNYFTVDGASTTNSAQSGVVTAVFPATAQDFAGGSGTIDNPYQISTAAQLDKIRFSLGSHFKLTADIDLSNYPVGDDNGWQPIGDNNNSFTGSLDGNGYKITNLTIDRSTTDNIGLFKDNGGVIRNVILENIIVKGRSTTGGLVGNNNGTIINSSVTGNVYGGDNNYNIGGLAGYNYGTINNSYATGIVSGGFQVGGLVGNNGVRLNNGHG